MMNFARVFGVLAVGGLSLAGAAFAEQVEPASGDILAKRIAHMRGVADDMRAIADMLYGVEPFKAARVAALSSSVSKRSGPAMVGLFASADQPKNSRARAAIWADPKSFQKHADDLKRLADELQGQAVKAGQDGTISRVQAIVARSAYLNIDRKLLVEARTAMQPLQKTFMSMAGQCKGCHKSFRKPKEEPAGPPADGQ